MPDDIKKLAGTILKRIHSHNGPDVFTIGVSGIDASGKGFVCRVLENELEKQNLKVANINIDPWQNPITVRLQKEEPARNFYNTVFRWDDFFSQLISPLKKNGSIHLETKLIRTDSDEYYPFTYDLNKIDILLIEGIFLFKKELRDYYDLKIWTNCSFETALQRAIARNSENLDKEQLIHDYQLYYYPAQRYHFEKDNPFEAADIIYQND
ncbi:MAG TPA: hypothetical protein VGQ53_18550 [Chitinophagaceae bacterium]|jgi:uridine kinase|nr:hypothetical protein [Chitinophagaceae bacterium]